MLRLFLLLITQILFVTAFDYENPDGVLIKKSWGTILNEFEKVTNRLLKELNLKSSPNLYNLIYTTTLGGKTFHLFCVKTPLSPGRASLFCRKTAWLISHENEWLDG